MRQAADKRDSALGWTGVTTDPARLVSLRHGQSPMSIRQEYSGSRSNPNLTEVSRQQAEAAARHLAALVDSGDLSFSATAASPQRRVQQTAEAVAKALGLDIRVREDLRETNFGQWEGMTFSEAHNATPEQRSSWLAGPTMAPPEGEDSRTVDGRVSTAHERIAQQFDTSDALVVSHVTPIKSLLRQGLGYSFEIFIRLHLDLASLSIAEFYADGPTSVRLINDASCLHGQQLGMTDYLDYGCDGYTSHSSEPAG